MTTDQRKTIVQATGKRRFPMTIFVSFFFGVMDMVSAWQRRAASEAIAAAIIFFIIFPLVAWLWHRTKEIDD